MQYWVRRHALTVLVLIVATWATSTGLDHHSSVRDWIAREALVVGIAAVGYLLCTAYAERVYDFLTARRGIVGSMLFAAAGGAVVWIGPVAVVPFVGLLAGATLAFDRAGLLQARAR